MKSRIVIALFCVIALAACTQRPPFMTNTDPALRKSSAQFAADAAHRHYPTTAPTAGPANGRCEIDYGIHRISIENSSNEDWDNVELWINQKYVVLLPKVAAHAERVTWVGAQSIFDDHGDYYPMN